MCTRRALTVLAVSFLLARVASAEEPEKPKPPRPRLRISGYIQVFFKARVEQSGDGTTEPTVFRVQRARLELEGEIVPRIDFDLEIDPRAPAISGVMRDAFISLRVIPHHKIRIGQQKTQFGYENNESSTRLYTVNRADISDNLARGVTLRDIGIGLIGGWPLGDGFKLEDAVTVVNGAGMNVQADDTGKKNVWGRVGARYRDKQRELSARLGVSGAIGDQSQPADPGPPATPAYVFNFTRLGADLELDSPWVFLAAEYVMGTDEAPADMPDVGGDRAGYYVLAAGKTCWDVGPVLRYDALEDFHRLTLGAYWGGPEAPLRVLLNYEFFEDELGRHDDRAYAWTQVRF